MRPVVKNGIVTLEGEVEWQFQREAALAVVRGLRGVKYATDQIQLKPTARPSPSDIKTKIEDALKRSAQVDARTITVAMTDSTVTLKGSVRSYWERGGSRDGRLGGTGRHRVDNRIEVAYEYDDDYE